MLAASGLVLAANGLYWWWCLPRSPRLTVPRVALRVLALSALSVVAVTIVFVLVSSLIYTEPWSSLP